MAIRSVPTRLRLIENNEMNDTDKHTVEEPTEGIKTKTPASKKWPVWISVILAMLSWMALMILSNDYSGYVALGLGIAAVVAGFRGAYVNERSLRRLAITATICRRCTCGSASVVYSSCKSVYGRLLEPEHGLSALSHSEWLRPYCRPHLQCRECDAFRHSRRAVPDAPKYP